MVFPEKTVLNGFYRHEKGPQWRPRQTRWTSAPFQMSRRRPEVLPDPVGPAPGPTTSLGALVFCMLASAAQNRRVSVMSGSFFMVEPLFVALPVQLHLPEAFTDAQESPWRAESPLPPPHLCPCSSVIPHTGAR